MNSKPVDLPTDLASAYLTLLSEREMLKAERDVVVAERDTVVAERDTAVAHATVRNDLVPCRARLANNETEYVAPEQIVNNEPLMLAAK